VRLRVEGAGIRDEYPQRFGFREFWIAGRDLFLNGVPIRLRPQTMPQEWSDVSGDSAAINGVIKGLRLSGFNIGEMWPGSSERRGQHHFHPMFYEAADRQGFLLMGSAGNIGDYIGWGQGQWKSPEARAEWEALTRAEMRRHRNHPSIVLWASSGNSFGHGHDQNPLAIGRRMEDSGLKWSDNDWKRARAMQGALAYMKRLDPTRGAFVHQGVIGDLWAVNSYLNFIPLQEGEEWLSAWARSGTKPYLPIEFGAPFPTSFMRGREHFGQAELTEPWMSEFAAIYLGPEAYRIETPEYRQAMREKFKSGQDYASWHNEARRDYSPTHMKIAALFTERIWRGWRALGTTAGMVPWSGGYAWQRAAARTRRWTCRSCPGGAERTAPKSEKNISSPAGPKAAFISRRRAARSSPTTAKRWRSSAARSWPPITRPLPTSSTPFGAAVGGGKIRRADQRSSRAAAVFLFVAGDAGREGDRVGQQERHHRRGPKSVLARRVPRAHRDIQGGWRS
jgi:beta-galactosidase